MPKIKTNKWKHFTKNNKIKLNVPSALKVLKCAGGSTSALSHHFEAVHAEAEIFNEKPNMKRKKTLHKLVKNIFIEKDIAKLASVIGLCFNRIANSSFIQERFNKYNCDKILSSNPVSARNTVLKQKRKRICVLILKTSQIRHRFS